MKDTSDKFEKLGWEEYGADGLSGWNKKKNELIWIDGKTFAVFKGQSLNAPIKFVRRFKSQTQAIKNAQRYMLTGK